MGIHVIMLLLNPYTGTCWLRRRRLKLHYTFRLYLNVDDKRVLGKGGAQILEAVDEYGSIAEAAEELEMSYKFVWDYLTRMRRRLQQPVVVTRRGGARQWSFPSPPIPIRAPGH